MTKKLTISIVTFNSEQIIEKCLNNFDVEKYEVIVVDNNSSDKTCDIIAQKFPSVKIIKLNINSGFGRANNLVLKQCKTQYALILNPDVLIRDKDLNQAVLNLENHPEIALASPKNIGDPSFNEQLIDQENPIIYQHFIVGGIMFVNIKNLQKIGFFNEEYFMFAEDSDLSNRSIDLGFKNAIFNNCLAIHFGGSSSTKTIQTIHRRFWHLGWSKTRYKRTKKDIFNYARSTIRLIIKYFFEGCYYWVIGKKQKSIGKFAFCFGCFASLIGLKAFDKNNNPRG